MAGELDFLLADTAGRRGDEWAWAVVTSVTPLQIRLDGDSAPLLGSPRTLVNPRNLHIGSRVRVQFARPSGRGAAQAIIYGPSDLETYPTSGRLVVTGVEITTASGGGYRGEASFPTPTPGRPAGWAPVYQVDYLTIGTTMVMLGSIRDRDAATVTALLWSPVSATLDVPLSWALRKTS